MLTPEGKKVPTRGRGMSAKKKTGQEQEKENEEEEDVVEVEEKAEVKNKEEVKQVGGESGFGWVVKVVLGGLWRMCVIWFELVFHVCSCHQTKLKPKMQGGQVAMEKTF